MKTVCPEDCHNLSGPLLVGCCCSVPSTPGDRPADVSQRRLASSITGASGGRLLAALALLAGGITAAATHSLPDVEAAAAAAAGSAAVGDAGVVAAAAAGALALVWPVVGPFVEVWRFSQLSGAEVEAAVAINEPLQVCEQQELVILFCGCMMRWNDHAEAVFDAICDLF